MQLDLQEFKSSEESHNLEHAQKLWEVSEKIIGINYF